MNIYSKMRPCFFQIIFSVLGLFMFTTLSLAAPTPQPILQVDEAIHIEKNAIFDASKSFIPPETKKIIYRWDFGDGDKGSGIEAIHSYKKSGKYKVTLTLEVDGQKYTIEEQIFVYRKFMLLLADISAKKNQIQSLTQFAENEGVYLKTLTAFDSASPFISEEVLAKKISENAESLRQADEVLVWTQGEAGLNALNRFVQNSQQFTRSDFENKVFLVIRDQLERTPFNKILQSLHPRQVFLAKEASIYPFIQSRTDDIATNLKAGGYEFKLIDDSSQRLYPWNFLSYLLNYLIENGVSENGLLLLLMLPVIAMVVVFMRQVVGLTTYGLYTPLILTTSFMVLGLKFALLTLFLAIFVSTLARYLLKNTRMLYIPKLGIVVAIVALALLGFLVLGISLQLFDRQFFSIAIFPMLIIGTLAEKFTSVQSKQSFISTLLITLQTIFTAIVAYVLVGGEMELIFTTVRWDFISNLLRSYPEIIFVALAIMVFLGKWTGLRIVEYIRFREILRHQEE